ncbi:hypothetical protein [Pelosinus propionicus]|uniref:Uncharacterized protein n=1 Tax=Pelosinus propionicus DSM 13327 TaxID=1123291 RepID=A0A1I4L253_9FIRM|nr:hypothetical protein [Pelosinus propionicus]SFL85054.1 hypothetical protein SAMN04490355_102146 [Pelosinus propionicus DSM 13327]
MAISITREKKNPKPKGEELFFAVDTVEAGVAWEEVSWYVPEDGCAGAELLSIEEGEAVCFVDAGGGIFVLPSVGIFAAADLSILTELEEGGFALFSEDFGFIAGGVGGIGFVGGVGVCMVKELLSH